MKHLLLFLTLLSCLLLATIHLQSCSSEGVGGEEGNGTSGGGSTTSYLSVTPNGTKSIKVDSKEKSHSETLNVKLFGASASSDVTASLSAWSKEEISTYNTAEKSSYTILPSTLYSCTPSTLNFKNGVASVEVKVTFDPSNVIAEATKNNANYAIALKLECSTVKLRDHQDNIIIPISFNCPTLEFAERLIDVSVAGAEVTKKIASSILYKVDGADAVNPFAFTCPVKVPDNAAELVTKFNSDKNASYKLLPSANYTLGKEFSFKEGANSSEVDFKVTRSGLEIIDYLLPIQLGTCSNYGVVSKSDICYLTVGMTYRNPIISDKSVPDPTVIRANDGYFYLYATQTKSYWMPMYRSKDLVNWEYLGTAFNNATKPTLTGGGAFWAPEVKYINNKYVMYFSWAQMNGAAQSYTAVAVSDSPRGPFPNSQALITNAEFGSNVIDQFYFEDNGHKYLFFGSFTGIQVTELTDDGLSVKRNADGTPVLKKKVCGNAFEGTNIYKKGKYYYLFASINNCCSGKNSNYKVVVGRSENVLGPYVDKKGRGMLDNSWELVLEGDGKKWIGPGHNSVLIQDDEGTEWMIYHSYVMGDDGEVGGRLGMLDKVVWTDGWPCIKNCVPSNSSLIPVFK